MHAKELIKNIETLFTWSTWLEAWIARTCALQRNDIVQHEGHIAANTFIEACNHVFQRTSVILDIHN